MQLPDERLDLLMACLDRRASPEEATGLRTLLLSDADALRILLLTAERRLVTAALIDALEEKGIIHPAPPREGRPVSLRGQLGRLRQQHVDRRTTQADALKEIVTALNAEGIVPLVIKGGVSLLTGDPGWRFQRDLDFAIEPDEADRTMALIGGLGFAVLKEIGASHHHLDSLSRGDPPVVVEPHLRVMGLRGARFLRGVPLAASAEPTRIDGLDVRLLRPEHALLHGMVHHHFENRGNNFGVITLKGLLEFAHALERLTPKEALRLAELLARRPVLRAATELWVAASDEWRGVEPPEALRPGKAARRRLARITARLTGPEAATMGEAFAEDMAGVARALYQGGWRSAPRLGALAVPVLDSLHNRPWGGPERAVKAAGILTLV